MECDNAKKLFCTNVCAHPAHESVVPQVASREVSGDGRMDFGRKIHFPSLRALRVLPFLYTSRDILVHMPCNLVVVAKYFTKGETQPSP
jgi:hypothetical protein